MLQGVSTAIAAGISLVAVRKAPCPVVNCKLLVKEKEIFQEMEMPILNPPLIMGRGNASLIWVSMARLSF
jgi:hypothetical protein